MELVSADLSQTNTHDEHLRKLALLPQLEELRLNYTSITNDGMRNLQAMPRPRRMEWGSTDVDGLGNISLAANTLGSMAGTNAGKDDIFLSMEGASGDLVWARTCGSSEEYVFHTGPAVDGMASLYLGGSTSGDLSTVLST